jgi:hypothetical protein
VSSPASAAAKSPFFAVTTPVNWMRYRLMRRCADEIKGLFWRILDD